MADLPPSKPSVQSLLNEKRNNHFLETHDKTDIRKLNNHRPPTHIPHKNGAIFDKIPPQHTPTPH
jgi:hypothetical protein